MEKLDLTKILKNCPKGFEFYSSVHGKLLYSYMYESSSASRIYFINPNQRSIVNGKPIIIEYSRDGRLYPLEGECILFPSKEQRDWSKFTAPWYKKEKFDPNTLQPFDRVLVRNFKAYKWKCEHFSYFNERNDYSYICSSGSYAYCVPYNDETKHLVGTSDEVPEYYRYWDD